MSQHVIIDRAHRPFKLARGPLPFVATDIGSGQFVLEDDPSELRDNIPLELRKRLTEIGWSSNDDKPVDQQAEWIKTPMSLLPALAMDRLTIPGIDANVPASPNLSPLPSPQKGSPTADRIDEMGLLRRNSSSGGPLHGGVKRRAVFVPALALAFPRLASAVFDPHFAVASEARQTLLDMMRNDPALLARPVLDLLSDSQKDMTAAISTLRAFLHVRRVLPPPMAHNIFNHLAGFLKFAARQGVTEEPLHDFANTIPILAKLVTQVSDMSIREIRRAKVELFLIPSGSLWFSSTAPTGPMFPRFLGSAENPFGDVPTQLVAMTMIRLSQNMLFLTMLKRNHQDVQLIRKNMSKLVLPSLESTEVPPLESKDFVPHKSPGRSDIPYIDARVNGLSLMLSRSYLLLVAQVFRCMSRHLNDRNELAVLVDGLNRILLAHGNDIGIVAQALVGMHFDLFKFLGKLTTLSQHSWWRAPDSGVCSRPVAAILSLFQS